MKIAIYGVSRSGKDYLIEHLVAHLSTKGVSLYHIKGSLFLNDLSLAKYGCKFKQLEDAGQDQIRQHFIEKVNELEKIHDNIVVDGHYAFYDEEMNFCKVFTDADLNFYDLFFYIDTKSEFVVDRMRNSPGDKRNNKYTTDDIVRWKNFEIDNMTNDLIAIGKELHVIRYESDEVFEYFDGVFSGDFDSNILADKALSTIDLSCVQNVILVDCDKTLSIEDTSMMVFKQRQIDDSPLNDNFKYDRYSNYQSFFGHRYFDKTGLFDDGYYDDLKNSLHFNEPLVNDLKTIKNVKVLAITAGNQSLWRRLLLEYELPIEVLDTERIMSKFVKYFVAKKLRDQGKFVVAIGDSMIDSLMLGVANKAYIVTNKGLRDNIANLLMRFPNIHQLSYSRFQYADVETEDCIGPIKCLDAQLPEVANYISICKSTSEKQGSILRDAHCQLGRKVGELIKTDFANSEFSVLVMMRAGLPFAEGIANYLDCPMVFSSEKDWQKSIGLLPNRKVIVADAVVNTGKSIMECMSRIEASSVIIAANVVSSKFKPSIFCPIYATRVSNNTFVGAKQLTVSDGKGPDTGDRLFRTI